jgi:lauroyl/myristoyl acyltransferase
MGEFFGDTPDVVVESTDSGASGGLLRHLKAGRSVYVALDDLARGRKGISEIYMMNQSFPRNDAPAWLATRSGRPVALWTTHWSGSRVVITPYALIYPDPSLPQEVRVAALSERLYRHAEAAIRAHPEAWGCWNYLHLVTGTAHERSRQGEVKMDVSA